MYFGDEVMVGADALDILADAYADPFECGRVVRSIKRRLLSPPRIALPGGQTVRPAEVVRHVITRLLVDATAALGEPVTHAVLARPALFDADQQAVLAEAAGAAGIDHVELADEPSMAATAFAADGGEVGRGAIVYDLGAGTFDAAFVAPDPDDDTFLLVLEPDGRR